MSGRLLAWAAVWVVIALTMLGSPPPTSGAGISSASEAACTATTAGGCRHQVVDDPVPTPPPVPGPAAGGGTGASGDVGSGCGLTDIGGCVNGLISGFFRGVISDALNPLLGLLSTTLLTTPTPDSLPAVGAIWAGSWQILLAVYGLIVLIAGVLVMAHGTVGSRSSVKEVGPRLVVGFLAGAVSLVAAERAVELANAVSAAVLGDGLDPVTAGNTLRDLVVSSLNHNFFLIFVAVFLVGMICALLLGYIIRVTLTLVLIAGAPLALMWHALPQTEPVAAWWWRAFGGCLAIQVVQSLTLITALKVFLAPGGFTPFGPTSNGVVGMLVALALMWVLYRVPFWVLGAVRRGGSRRSLVGGLLRSYVAYKTFGLLTGRGRGGSGGGRGSAGPGGGGRRGPGRGGPPSPTGPGGPAGTPPDPYARVRATASGQYVLPLPGVRRTTAAARTAAVRPTGPPARPATPTPPSAAPGPRRGRQLALPLGEDWPEHRPVPGRDGQYRLPIAVPRVPAGRRPTGPSPAAVARRRAGTQLELPFDPYRGVRPTPTGQYPLPLDGVPARPRRPATSAPATVAAPARPARPGRTAAVPPPAPVSGGTPGPVVTPGRGAGRQLRLPLDLPRPPRPPRPSPAPHPPPPVAPPPPASPPTSPSALPPAGPRTRRRST